MKKEQLAYELRHAQCEHAVQHADELGVAAERVIFSAWLVDDDTLIDSYITCSYCGERWLDEEDLEFAIGAAHSADDFIVICDEMTAAM